MLGSLTLYRRLLLENVFSKPNIRRYIPFCGRQDLTILPSFGHGIAGILAGTTVSFIAAPVEHIKARLQVQYAADKTKRLYSGPIDCLTKMVCVILRLEDRVLTIAAPLAWHQRSLPRTLGNSLLSIFLLLLVELLRHSDSCLQGEDDHVCSSY